MLDPEVFWLSVIPDTDPESCGCSGERPYGRIVFVSSHGHPPFLASEKVAQKNVGGSTCSLRWSPYISVFEYAVSPPNPGLLKGLAHRYTVSRLGSGGLRRKQEIELPLCIQCSVAGPQQSLYPFCCQKG
jgi:hypothetical protein